MRTLKRNRRTLYYAQPTARAEIHDEYGNPTGEYTEGKGEIQSAEMNISPETGVTVLTETGVKISYTRKLVTDDMDCPINELTVLWIDAPTDGDHNYIVKCISKSLNSVKITAERVIK